MTYSWDHVLGVDLKIIISTVEGCPGKQQTLITGYGLEADLIVYEGFLVDLWRRKAGSSTVKGAGTVSFGNAAVNHRVVGKRVFGADIPNPGIPGVEFS